MIAQIIEITAVLIGLFLVLKNADSFKTASGSVGSVYTGAITALQGGKSG
jgi:hypothetical protein